MNDKERQGKKRLVRGKRGRIGKKRPGEKPGLFYG
jgi:hypothetical protein